jgi:tetratricopeptide (TPR) repeat protein
MTDPAAHCSCTQNQPDSICDKPCACSKAGTYKLWFRGWRLTTTARTQAVQLGTMCLSILFHRRRRVLATAATAPPGEKAPKHLWPDSINDITQRFIDLATRYHRDRAGDAALLGEATTLARQVLVMLPDEHPDRALWYDNLAYFLRRHGEQTGDMTLLDEAIEIGRKRLALCSDGHSAYAQACRFHESTLWLRWHQTGDITILDEAIMRARKVLTLCPDGDAERAQYYQDLAILLGLRHRPADGTAMLDEAIALEHRVLSLCPERHPKHAEACMYLADTLKRYYRLTGNTAQLDEAITLERKCIALCPTMHVDHARWCRGLNTSLWLRYHSTGDAALIDEAIAVGRRVLTLLPVGHAEHGSYCGMLAALLVSRNNQTDDTALLDEAIALGRQAVALCPDTDSEHATWCGNLAGELRDRYDLTGDAALLDEVTILGRKVLSLRPAGHPKHAKACIGLALSLRDQYECTSGPNLLDEAVDLAHQSLSGLGDQHWQSLAFLCDIHLDPNTPYFSITKATAYLHQWSCEELTDVAISMEPIISRFALLWASTDMWNSDTHLHMVTAYSNIIDKIPRLAGHVLGASLQLRALGTLGPIASDACIAALLAQRPTQAIELFDRAQGIMWAQALHQRDPQVAGAPSHLADELRGLLRAVSLPAVEGLVEPVEREGHYLTPQDIRHQQNSRIQVILREIRAMPGLERFMLGHTFAQLREAARDHPVVVLVAAHGHVFALIVADSRQEGPHPLRLDFTTERLSLLRDHARKAGLRNGAAPYDLERDVRLQMQTTTPKAMADALSVLKKLWHSVVKPVLDHLQLKVRSMVTDRRYRQLKETLQPTPGRSRPRLHWCSTSDFTFLPLHAAGIYDGSKDARICCSDYVVSSYTPTVSALLRAQAKLPSSTPSRLSILAVAEDCRTVLEMPRLWNVESELAQIKEIMDASRIDCAVDTVSTATVRDVTERIQEANFVHLACHGTQHQTDALESGFYLKDGRLTVSKLMNLNLNQARFAYLSACETAKGDEKQPDQAVHLAAAMLFAGFRSVVATMW